MSLKEEELLCNQYVMPMFKSNLYNDDTCISVNYNRFQGREMCTRELYTL